MFKFLKSKKLKLIGSGLAERFNDLTRFDDTLNKV
jgi:hypothetical protein